ncbi:hypothetical protein FB451DRAFT_1550843 [Mycena latifolia]|nr:hypothetical protein FB451DRAFT_1550843 [Mycena latifolia]
MSDSLRRRRSESASPDSQRPAQRQRMDEPSEALTRDLIFFKDSGDCYLQAEDSLFKIHRYHLLRGDSSVFSDMFSLPSGDHPLQGASESNPIVLAGDSAERLRAFLSIAYAELLEFQVTDMRPDQLPTLIHCAHFAHKYNISPLLSAALRAIIHVADAKPALDSKVYVSLLELSTLCEAVMADTDSTYKDKIRHAVEWGWFALLEPELEFPDISEALDAAEQYGLTHLLAFSCLHYLIKTTKSAPQLGATGIFAPFNDHPWLKPAHRLRILSAAWSLEYAWAAFAAKAPEFPPGYVCRQTTHATVCVPRWRNEWKRAMSSTTLLAIPSGRFPDRMIQLKHDLGSVLTLPCISAAFKGHDPIASFRNKVFMQSFYE